MVRKHDPAGAHSNRARAAGDMPDHYCGRGARNSGHAMVLGEPKAVVAERLRLLRQAQGVTQRIGGGGAQGDRRQVED